MTKLIVHGRPQRWKRPEQRLIPAKGKRKAFVTRYTDKECEAHKKMVGDLLRDVHDGPPWLCGVAIRVRAVFEPPASISKELRAACLAGKMPHTCDPDLDQIIKQIMDAAVGIVYVDDNQVAHFSDSAKRYGSPERTEIEFIRIAQPEGLLMPTQKALRKRQGLPPSPQPGRDKQKRLI